MKILAFDCSGAACSAALWMDGGVRVRRFEAMARGQTERLMPMLLEVVAEAGVGFLDIDIFASTVGPGAFTGLRVGLATLRGLALAAGRPLLGVTSLEAVAHATRADERRGRILLVVLESRRDDIYAQAFTEALRPQAEPLALLPAALAARFAGQALLVAGEAAPRALPALRAAGSDLRAASTPGLPDAAVVAALAAARSGEARRTPPAPLYLRPPDVTLPGRRAP